MKVANFVAKALNIFYAENLFWKSFNDMKESLKFTKYSKLNNTGIFKKANEIGQWGAQAYGWYTKKITF